MVKNTLAQPEVQRAVKDEKVELSAIFKDKARAIVTSIDADVIDKGNLLQRATSAAICLDKSLLLAGEATANIDVRVLLDVAGMIRARREQEDQDQQKQWERTHALPSPAPVVDHVVDVVPPTRATAPIPPPAPLKKPSAPAPVEPTPLLPNQSMPAVAGMTVRYHEPTPLPDDEDDANVLMRGLRS